MKFILQIYAPGNYVDESAPDNAFHRIVYLFVCSSKNNCPAEPIVIRQQLPQVNKFYPQEAPDYEVCTSSRNFLRLVHVAEKISISDFSEVVHVRALKTCNQIREILDRRV